MNSKSIFLALSTICSATAMALSPDDFSTDQAQISVSSSMGATNNDLSWMAAPGALGGFRQLGLVGGSGTGAETMSTEIAAGSWDVSFDAGITGTYYASVLWSDTNGNTSFTTPVDLTQGGTQSKLTLTISSLMAGDGSSCPQISIQLRDSDSSDEQYRYPCAAGDVEWLYSSFSGITFTEIERLIVRVYGFNNVALDVSASSLTPVDLMHFSID